MKIEKALKELGISKEVVDFISEGYEGDDKPSILAFKISFLFTDVLIKARMVHQGKLQVWGKVPDFTPEDKKIISKIIAGRS